MGTDPTGLSPTTKMLVPLFVLLASSFIAVESAIAFGTCPRSDWGKETTEEKWECRNGESSCFSSTDTCSHDGSQQIVEGTAHYDADGSFREVGGGWDCRDKCRGCRFSCSGSQSRTSFGPRPSSGFGFGSSSGSSGSRPSGGSQNRDYRCTSGGGCEVSFGGTLGSCFPRDFGGSCSGTPRQCQDCNQAKNC